MFGIGMPELLVILGLALIILGPKKLPDIARGLGKAMREFRRATSDLKEHFEEETRELQDVTETIKEEVSFDEGEFGLEEGDAVMGETGEESKEEVGESRKESTEEVDESTKEPTEEVTPSPDTPDEAVTAEKEGGKGETVPNG